MNQIICIEPMVHQYHIRYITDLYHEIPSPRNDPRRFSNITDQYQNVSDSFRHSQDPTSDRHARNVQTMKQMRIMENWRLTGHCHGVTTWSRLQEKILKLGPNKNMKVNNLQINRYILFSSQRACCSVDIVSATVGSIIFENRFEGIAQPRIHQFEKSLCLS